MAQQANIQAQTRSDTGKGAARTLRRSGKVPAVIYGHDRPSEAVTVETLALSKLLGQHQRGDHHRRRHRRSAGAGQGADPRDPA